MTFEQALTAMRAGKKVRRPGWMASITLDWIKEQKGSDDPNLFSFDEILADDWEIVSEPQPDPTIEELRRAVVAIADEMRARNGELMSGQHVAPLRRPTDQ